MTNDTSGRVSEASCLSRGTPELSQMPFSNRAPGRPIHGQVNGTQERACTYPGTTGIMEQVSDNLSKLDLVSRGTFQWSQAPLSESSGHIHGKQRSQRSPNTSGHSVNIDKTRITSP
ncbi:hypothetical protein CDL15_Pgr012661 [Punica granatum]|uniref:Uncharacterized protein n=1 Tax=Punica granatum TaxID=22663 RepID=A0A218WPG4_PUNGR|nr:hypothetical protein CDL15_Pgr012661 [Punica granatum]